MSRETLPATPAIYHGNKINQLFLLIFIQCPSPPARGRTSANQLRIFLSPPTRPGTWPTVRGPSRTEGKRRHRSRHLQAVRAIRLIVAPPSPHHINVAAKVGTLRHRQKPTSSST